MDKESANKFEKMDLVFVAGIVVSYSCFFISTMLKATFFIELFSPITGFAIGITILGCLKRMGRFWKPSFILALGIFSYAFADILIFISNWITGSEKLYEFAAFIFLLPNYFFGASVGFYFIQKLKGKDLYRFLINSLTFTVIGIIALRRILVHLGTYDLVDQGALIRIYLYFTVNIFILIMIVHMTLMIATDNGLKGTNTMIFGIIGYILLDFPYTYVQALGQDPENIYTNLVYMLCMILMAHGIYHQVHHHHVFQFKPYKYTQGAVRRTRIVVLAGLILSIILMVLKVIESGEFFYVAFALLAYWITTATFQNSALSEQLLKQQDILTGLYNRRYSSTVLEEAVNKAKEQSKRFVIFCVDLNCFKPINDTYGHDMGDRVLKEFGSRMLALPKSYTSFRTGGDEFMLVREEISEKEEIVQCARDLQKLFNTPLHIDTYIFSLSGSIGVSVYPDDSEQIETLVRYADAAMYAVKHSGKKDNFRLFDSSLVETVEKHRALEERLRKAEPDRDFILHYQPRIDAFTGRLTAAEVFPRLKGESNYTAADLLPITEEVGLMNRLGNWIIETAIRQLKTWRDTCGQDISISVNLSPLQLLDMDFLENLKVVVKKNDLSPSKVHLDISNDVIMGASITAKETLRNLNEYGFKLSLNDFGGDDINLNHILTCGFSAIHMSPSLIHRADSDEDANVLIETIVGLAGNMNIDAYAVGIETKEQGEKLKSMGVRALQGYYYGKPVEAEEFTRRYF
ncbi:putative bifunctional diguanylate cyclase/phosphodiesterase [Butyrivibrio sp. CB08]|uniref:putative bifunctional diguanylate cyclase/phosphodiesterase n=1 Tax=Butyrivibrio sp. CB08 TaxID=2364879 RepID=UPI0013147D26|nr:EAL domain-containing protein [Butyrivibrio sp. CB08]